MSEKTTCPACGSHLSSITFWLRDDGPYGATEGSPCCGLSYGAFREIETIRNSRASQKLKERTTDLVKRNDELERENRRLRDALQSIRDAVAETEPVSQSGEPHE